MLTEARSNGQTTPPGLQQHCTTAVSLEMPLDSWEELTVATGEQRQVGLANLAAAAVYTALSPHCFGVRVIKRRPGLSVQATFTDLPAARQARDALLTAGRTTVRLPAGELLLPVRHSAAVRPAGCVTVTVVNPPDHLLCRQFVSLVLRCAGYGGTAAVEGDTSYLPPLSSQQPEVPCTAAIFAYVRPPPGDASLRRIPASFWHNGCQAFVRVSTEAASQAARIRQIVPPAAVAAAMHIAAGAAAAVMQQQQMQYQHNVRWLCYCFRLPLFWMCYIIVCRFGVSARLGSGHGMFCSDALAILFELPFNSFGRYRVVISACF